MVLIKGRQIVMTTAMNTDQRYFPGVDLLQRFAVPDGDEPILRAMNNIGMAGYIWYPFVCPQVKT